MQEAGFEAETPSQVVLRRAGEVISVTDRLGRRLKVRRIGALARYDLLRLLGPDAAGHADLIGLALVAQSVCEIDSEPVAPLRTERELRALIQRLDDEGLDAASAAHEANFNSHSAGGAEGEALGESLGAGGSSVSSARPNYADP